MIYHIINSNAFHHVPGIINGILMNAEQTNTGGKKEHFFFLRVLNFSIYTCETNKYTLKIYIDLFIQQNIDNYKFIYKDIDLVLALFRLSHNDQLILHDSQSLWRHPTLFWLLLFFKGNKFRKRVSFILWGVTEKKLRTKNFIHGLLISINDTVFKSFKSIITLTIDDEKKMKDWYGLTNTLVTNYILAKPLNFTEFIKPIPKKTEPVVIMVSHSSHPHNKQIEVFEMLERYKDENIQILCPVSYGDASYRIAIIDTGKKVFGNKFIYIDELLSRDEYHKMLATVDIYISNASVQTGLYGIHVCMFSGKKLFLKDNNLNEVKSIGVYAENIEKINSMNYQEFSKPLEDIDRERNIQLGAERQKHLKDQYIRDWQKIYK